MLFSRTTSILGSRTSMDHTPAHLESWAQLEPLLLETRRRSVIPLGLYPHGTHPLRLLQNMFYPISKVSLPTDVLKGTPPSPTRCLQCTSHSQVPNLIQTTGWCLACQWHCAAEWRSRGGRRHYSQSRLPFPPLLGCPFLRIGSQA